MSRIAILLIRAYQYAISPLLGQNCRFYPSCSQYSKEAFERHGFLHGSLLAMRRVLRCNPWHAGGHDSVP